MSRLNHAMRFAFLVTLAMVSVTMIYYSPYVLRLTKFTSLENVTNFGKLDKDKPIGKLKKADAMEKPVISFGYIGRLGNNMFQYAVLYDVARRLSLTPIITKNDAVFKTFRSLQAKVVENINTTGFQKLFLSPPCAFDYRAYKLDTTRNTELTGYGCSWVYFLPHRADEIRKQFTVREQFQSQAFNFVQKATAGKNRTVVGIHVRRGDFLYKDKVAFGYVVPNNEYFTHAMDYFSKKYTNAVFVVVSNDINWCKTNINGTRSNPVFYSGNSREVDLAILSMSNHVIMSVGTFGWWGGFLSGGEVVYYKHQYKEKSTVSHHYRFSEFILPSWKAMT